jgi:hypothetical protein
MFVFEFGIKAIFKSDKKAGPSAISEPPGHKAYAED